MSAPAGNQLVFGYGFEQSDNIWQPSAINKWIPLKTLAGMLPKRPLVRVENMDPSGQTLRGSNLAAPVTPKLEWQPGADEIVPILAHLNRKWSFGAQQGGGSGPFPFTSSPRVPGDSANPLRVDSIVGVASDGDGYPILVSGKRFAGFSYKIDANKFQMFSLDGHGCFDSYTDDASVLMAGTYGGKPIVRGHWDETKVGPLKIKVTAAAAGGFDGTVKLTTTGGYAGATTIQVKFDTWYRVALDDGSRLGISKYEDLWFCIPSTSPATLLAIGQEWSFANQRAIPVPSYSGRNPLNASAVQFLLDEGLSTQLEVFAHSIEVKRTYPKTPNMVIGSKYARNIQDSFDLTATLTINRDREDREFLKRLIASQTINVRTYCYGDPFATSGFDEMWKSEYGNCQVSDDTRDVTVKGTLPEQIVLEASRVGSTAIWTDTVNTSLSVIS